MYTHWGGSYIPLQLQEALKKRWRWDDPAYLARIIYDTLVDDEFKQETGYGISPYICDNEHPIVYVDMSKQMVTINGNIWTFQEYIDASEDDLQEAFDDG